MNIQNLSQLDNKTKERILKRSRENIDGVIPYVTSIINDVRDNGDKTIRKYTKKFDVATISD